MTKFLPVFLLLALSTGCATASNEQPHQVAEVTRNCVNCTYEQMLQLQYIDEMNRRAAEERNSAGSHTPNVTERVIDRAVTTFGYTVEKEAGNAIDRAVSKVWRSL